MRFALMPHPTTPEPAVAALTCEVARPGGDRLALRYRLVGDLQALAVPPASEPARADELWRHTCFEAFLRTPGTPDYLEFNFSPSTAWAAYAFDDYRSGMRLADVPNPSLAVECSDDVLCVTAELHDLPPGVWSLALTAVIENRDDRRSYWALSHPPGPPDFHRPDCFVAEVPPPPAP